MIWLAIWVWRGYDPNADDSYVLVRPRAGGAVLLSGSVWLIWWLAVSF